MTAKTNRLLLAAAALGAALAAAYFGTDGFRSQLAQDTDKSIPGAGSTLPSPAEPPKRSEQSGSERTLATASGDNSVPRTPKDEVESALESLNPAELYLRYISQAESGDHNAQYVLVTALQECQDVPSTTAEIDDLRRSGTPTDILTAVESRFQRCRPLLVSVSDLNAEYQHWYQAALESQHPLLLVQQRNVDLEEKRERVKAAISGDYPEPYLYSRAYLEAAILYREYPEQIDMHRDAAWQLVYCGASLKCNSAGLLEYFRNEKYHAHEVEEILTIQTSIEAALQRGDWNALGL